jgi:hypothetical protein
MGVEFFDFFAEIAYILIMEKWLRIEENSK